MKLILTVTKWYQLDDGHFTERNRGDRIEVSDQVGEWLLRNGSAKHPEDGPEEATGEASPAGEVLDQEDHTSTEDVSADEGNTVGDDDQLDRPANAANRPTWDAYARKVGVDPTQFKSKEELMAALP